MSFNAKLSYAVMCLAGILLAITGIGTFAFGKPPMTHWVLMAHVAAAPVFALGLAAVALTGSAFFAGRSDPPLSCAAKALFWLVLLCGLVVLLSGVVPMTPVFGTRGQHLLYLTHRYAGIVLAVAVALHIPVCLRRAS
jgi:cytochrome b subunit of formate dehydrogenase